MLKVNKMKVLLIAISLLVSVNIFSQSITTTMGTNGTFSIKNGTSNYLTISQSSGQVYVSRNLYLGVTTGSTQGVLYFGSNRFFHIYGSNNTFLGENAGNFTLDGPWNTGVGSGVLQSLTDVNGNSNTGFGMFSLNKTTSGSDNTGFGFSTLKSNTTGICNSAFGNSALSGITTATYNSVFGVDAFPTFSTGDSSAVFGYASLNSNLSGDQNSSFGCFSLYNNTTGYFNTALGFNAGSSITTGFNLTCLGYNSQPTTGSASNQITLGNSSVTVLRSTVTTIASLSDARDKKNIRDLTLGLDFIMTLKPREYNWDKREWYESGISDGTKMKEVQTAGFVAQELDGAQTSANAEWLNLVLKDNPEKWEATPGNLLPVIVKAVQELNTESEGIKNVSDELVNKDKDFQQRISKFEEIQNILRGEIEKVKSTDTKVTEVKWERDNND